MWTHDGFDDDGTTRRLQAGDRQVIRPDRHHGQTIENPVPSKIDLYQIQREHSLSR